MSTKLRITGYNPRTNLLFAMFCIVAALLAPFCALARIAERLLTPDVTRSMPAPNNAMLNRLLAALPADDLEQLLTEAELVELPLGSVLYEPGSPLQYAYFPTTAIVSLVSVMEDGHSTEAAIVGSDGLIGVTLLLGGGTFPIRTVVQHAGFAYRLARDVAVGALMRPGPLQQLVLRYTQALISQIIQTAACNRHHTVDQQLCRWLLLILDRLQSDEIRMTQELMANMLGVRREGVTEAARKLQAAGLICYSRGRIHITDRAGLQMRVCECYLTVRKEYARLLPDAQPPAARCARDPVSAQG